MNKGEMNIARRHPEWAIGGFTHKDSTFIFYSMVRALVDKTSILLDLGAGRGAQGESKFPFKRTLVNFKGTVQRVAGTDVDPAVLNNPMLDEAHVVEPGAALPFDDESFDVIFSDWVLEHVDEPAPFVCEIRRVLKPGGWFCARTPNKHGMISVAARLIPNHLHTRVLNKIQPDRKDHDVFPTRYRLNTKSAISRHFPAPGWMDRSFLLNTEVMYVTRYRGLFNIVEALSKLLPNAFSPVLMVFVQKVPGV